MNGVLTDHHQNGTYNRQNTKKPEQNLRNIHLIRQFCVHRGL
jgi:hypothetical protein